MCVSADHSSPSNRCPLRTITHTCAKRERERESMETLGLLLCSSSSSRPFLIKSMAAQKPSTRLAAVKRGSVVFPVGEPGPQAASNGGAPPVKLLSNVEKMRLLTKAEKAGLLSAAEKYGLSLSTVERLGLLSKAEELGVLSAATDPGTPRALLTLSLVLLALGPACVFVVPEENAMEVALQVIVALACVFGGSAAFAASSFVSNLQRSS